MDRFETIAFEFFPRRLDLIVRIANRDA